MSSPPYPIRGMYFAASLQASLASPIVFEILTHPAMFKKKKESVLDLMKFTEKSNPINTTYLKESLQTTKALKTNPGCRNDSSYTINTQNTAKTFKSVESLQS